MLLLDPTPSNENLLVRIVRPGEEVEKVLEESRKQLAANANRRRKRGRSGNGTSRVITRSSIENPPSISGEELTNSITQETKAEATFEEVPASEDSQELTNHSLTDTEPPLEEEKGIEDSRRRRRRSSASAENGS